MKELDPHMLVRLEKRTHHLVSEFRLFMLKQDVTSLAVAFILGAAASSMIQETVRSIVMPLVNLAIPNQAWKDWKIVLSHYVNADGKIAENSLLLGNFVWNFINLLVVVILAFVLSKYLIFKATPRMSTRTCPFCLESVLREARVCKYCTRDLPPLETLAGDVSATNSAGIARSQYTK
jgi:large conductance mechanosensitive channel